MIFHRINIPTVTKTIGEPGKQDSTQNSSDHIQQKQTDENKELNITLEQAKDIALQKAGVSEQVYFKEAKLDFEDGRWKYEIEFMQDNVEYEAEIDAQTGVFYKWKIDRD